MLAFFAILLYNMPIMDIKENLARNLTACRKAFNLTQAELAEKLNYSDKAVSKWERGESVPDLSVLVTISKFYGISIDKLVSDSSNIRPKITKSLGEKRALVLFSSIGFVLLLAVIGFAVCNILEVNFKTWLVFIFATPIISAVSLTYASLWKKLSFIALSLSFLVWSILLTIFLTLTFRLPTVPEALWQIFLLGIPLQVIIILLAFLNNKKSNK